ncbi:MAG: cation:dicarboxylase symporter family transporter [Methylococcales bacterium]|nr:cation:dicarboxylase symporter family transporter [Methylococcales bacterium]
MLTKTKLPLSLQVVVGVCVGTLLGVLFGTEPYFFDLLKNDTLGQLGMLVIRLLKTLATPLFLTQAISFNLDITQQLLIVAAAVMVGVGISGIPEAGLIALPLVLSTIGLSEQLVIAIIPLIATIDWIIAHVRSVVNVMSDMLVAILLDRFAEKERVTHE